MSSSILPKTKSPTHIQRSDLRLFLRNVRASNISPEYGADQIIDYINDNYELKSIDLQEDYLEPEGVHDTGED
jgi:hypothetical protein